jgi:hypothetical protein
LDDFDDAGVEADVFGSAAAGQDEGVVLLRFDLIESGIQNEIVAALFRVRLVAFEVVNGGADGFTGFLGRADGVNGVAHHQERLEWNHYFIIFDVVADKHQNGFLGHEHLRKTKRIAERRCAAETGRYACKQKKIRAARWIRPPFVSGYDYAPEGALICGAAATDTCSVES